MKTASSSSRGRNHLTGIEAEEPVSLAPPPPLHSAGYAALIVRSFMWIMNSRARLAAQ